MIIITNNIQKKHENPIVEDYRHTMSADTKSASRREQRIEALSKYVLQDNK